MLRVVLVGVFIVISGLCQADAWGTKPLMNPEEDEIYLNVGDKLQIECTSTRDRKLHFSHPPQTDSEGVVGSESHVLIEGNKYTFVRRNTTRGDAGWYACAEDGVDIDPQILDRNQTNIRWIYVWVKSDTYYFVREGFTIVVPVHVGDSAVIPCTPTSPDFAVDLSNNGAPVVMDGWGEFDPKFGFIIRKSVITDDGLYTCRIGEGENSQEVNYYLDVSRRVDLPEPRIDVWYLRHVTRGEELHVNCTIEAQNDANFDFNWTTPQTSSRIRVKQVHTKVGSTMTRWTSELIINNVTDDDAGEFICFVRRGEGRKFTKHYVNIYDPNETFIMLKPRSNDTSFEIMTGESVQWVVDYEAYPRITLQWFDPKGEEITTNWSDTNQFKRAINVRTSSVVLKINRLRIQDAGVYQLLAVSKEGIKTINFTLTILGQPEVMLTPGTTTMEGYYKPNKSVLMSSSVLGYPEPKITWQYLECPDFPNKNNCTELSLSAAETKEDGAAKLSSQNITFRMSGVLTCRACNDYGCGSVSTNILISEIDGPLVIIEPQDVIKGDDVFIDCAASIYNYTDKKVWSYDDGNRLTGDRYNITTYRTQFTTGSKLQIHNVEDSDQGLYVCEAEIKDGGHETASYNMTVYEPVPPCIYQTNLNKSIFTRDLNPKKNKVLSLECFVKGMPTPKVTWYKDGTAIKLDTRYKLLHDNQELRVEYLLEDDAGKYSCRAENRVGTNETHMQLVLTGGKHKSQTLWFIIIAIFIVVVVGLITYLCIKVHRERVLRKELMEAGLTHFVDGAVECLNSELTVDDQAELLPYDKKWEFPRDRLKLGKQLGSGAFGVVMKAEAQGISEDGEVTTVAVKMVRRTAEPTYIKALASELKIMAHLGKHLNVVNLLGACTKNISKRELLVIVEYCRFGNLHNYLLRHRDDFINQIDPTTGKIDPNISIDLLTRRTSVTSGNKIKYAALSFSRSLSVSSGSNNSASDPADYRQGMDSQGVSMSPDGCILSNNSVQPGWRSNYRGDYKERNVQPICTADLLCWAFQVARGMEYLSFRKVLHGDLAARNILLAEDNVVKICDFGLAKTMYKDENYKKKGEGPLPIKWMAIESIRDRVFSTQSDIWSFGIVLWEFFTLAEMPYPGLEAEKQYQKLVEGYRMEQPEFATKELYDTMLQCWEAKPTLRPSFTKLAADIGNLLDESVKMHYVNLNAPYLDMNTLSLETGKEDYLMMMSAPDHAALSSPGIEYVNSVRLEVVPDSAYLCMSPVNANESGIFSPRHELGKSHFEFPSPTVVHSDSEDGVELAPMLQNEDPYLKPINVHQRRAEFARQRQTQSGVTDRPIDRDSGYCNTPRNVHLIDLHETVTLGENETDSALTPEDVKPAKGDSKDVIVPIIRTEDNYVNMPRQKGDLLKETTDSFSNPSYVIMSKLSEKSQFV